MNILAKAVVLVGTCVILSGCMSYMRLESSKDEIATRRAMASGDQRAIRAANLGEGAAGIGIDVSNLDALKQHPWQQLGAALVDAVTLYGAKVGVDALNDNGDSKDEKPITATVNGNFNNVTVITGDQNTIGSSSEEEAVVGE